MSASACISTCAERRRVQPLPGLLAPTQTSRALRNAWRSWSLVIGCGLALQACSLVSPPRAGLHAEDPAGAPWQLVWADEFDADGSPAAERWRHDTGGHGWGNAERQCYTGPGHDNASVSGGRLLITARREAHDGCDYTSARLITRGRGDWRYGRLEIRARLPAGRGTWPAIWMMPSDWEFSRGGWPDVGEIDIMEHVGHDPGRVHASAHTRAYNWRRAIQKTADVGVPDATTAFHVYALEWDRRALRASVDGHTYFTYRNEGRGRKSWPFDRPFYLILNLAVGGTWGGAQGVDDAAFPATMEIDFVRVYQRTDPGGPGP